MGKLNGKIPMFTQILEGFKRTSREGRIATLPESDDSLSAERLTAHAVAREYSAAPGSGAAKKHPAEYWEHQDEDWMEEQPKPRPRAASLQGLRIKSYYASSVQAAVEMARQELGPDAMIVKSMKTGPESRDLGEYEVVFAVTPGTEPAGAHRGPTAPRVTTAAAPPEADPGGTHSLHLLFGEISELRRQLETMKQGRQRPSYHSSRLLASSRQFAEFHAQLVASDLDYDFAHEVLECVDARLALDSPLPPVAPGKERTYDAKTLRRAVVQELESRFSVDASVGVHGAPAVTVLVGPPGAGKTSTLVKLAVKYGLTARKPVHILSMDNYRVAAAAQLRSFAAILGVGFSALETLGSLSQALEEHRSKGLVLVDSPGFSVADLDAGMDLARYLSARPKIDTQLVLPASMRAADLSRAVDRFEIFGPRKLIFTKLDETESFGPLLGESARTGKPISFLADGQRIPENLAAADKSRIIDLVLRGNVCPAA